MNQRTTQLPAKTYWPPFARLLAYWYRAPDHPAKLRLLAMIERLAGRHRLVANTDAGFEFTIDRADLIQRTVLHTREWEPLETQFFKDHLTTSDVFYDIGSNVGYFTCLALHQQVRHVTAFDPDPLNLDVLKLNLDLNTFAIDRWTLVNQGLGARSETRMFHRSHVANTGISGLACSQAVDSFPVPIVSLDEFVLDSKVPRPTVIKIDVEGWEGEVLAGARRLLSEAPPRLLLIEAHCTSDGALADAGLGLQLRQAGYSIRRLASTVPLDARDNFIATLS